MTATRLTDRLGRPFECTWWLESRRQCQRRATRLVAQRGITGKVWPDAAPLPMCTEHARKYEAPR